MLSAPDAEIVRRDGGLPGIAVLLDPDAFLELFCQTFPGISGITAAIQYLRYKPGSSCLCAYRVTTPNGVVQAYGKAFSRERREKLRHWLTPPTKGESSRRASERWQLGLSIFPDDRRLTALSRLQSSPARTRVLAAALVRRPQWCGGSLTALRYKPERRFVARLDEGTDSVAVVKLYAAGGFNRARRRADLFQQRESLLIPRCAGQSSVHRLLVFEWVHGASLQQLLTQRRGLDAAETTGRALAELHNQAPAAQLAEPPGTTTQALVAAARSVATTCPQIAAQIGSLVTAIVSDLDETPASFVPVHGDFYAEQVIATAGVAAILDCDRACLADAATDLGSFAAHLNRAASLGVCSRAHAEAAMDAVLTGYGRQRSAPTSARLSMYTAAALIRLAPEPFRRHEADWVHQTEAIVGEAAVLAGLGGRRQPRSTARRARTRAVVVDDPPGLARDDAWSFLRPALDPPAMRRQLGSALARLGVVGADLRTIRVSRYKPGRRCVIEYGFETADREPLVLFGKSRLRGLNSHAHRALEALWRAGFRPDCGTVCVPQPVGTLPDLHMTLHRKANGVASTTPLAASDGRWTAERIAEAIHTLHARAAVPDRHHSMADEVRILRDRLPQLNGRVGAVRLERLVRAAERLAAQLPAVERRAIHRDFYPDHALVDGARVWLIDFDLFCAGDPALDAGNFLAHMIEARLRDGAYVDRLSDAEAAFETRYLQVAGGHAADAVRAYTTLSLARHVHLSTLFPERRHTTLALVDLCERRLLGVARNA